MNRARLLILADFLEKLPPERFDYGSWVGANWGGAQDLSCGTTACAVGWCPQVPEFKGLGLRYQRDGDGNPYVVGANFDGDDYEIDMETTLGVARKLFDLTDEEALLLFVPDHDDAGLDERATAKDVATLIRRFVAGEVGPS